MKAHKSSVEILAHPGFINARNALINEFADLFTSSRFLTRLIADSGCLMLTAVLVGFHANHDDDDPATWATPGRVQSMIVERGLASVRRLDDLIARFHATGYLARVENPADGRSRILRPTELLL